MIQLKKHDFILIIFSLLPACAFYSSEGVSPPLEKNCVLPADQSSTISGRWTTYPIPIAFFSSTFNSNETGSIIRAADTWNSFFQASQGLEQAIYYGNSSTPTQSSNNDPATASSTCSQGILSGTTYRGNIVLYKLSPWSSAYSSSAIALTTYCSLPSQPYPKFYMAIIEFNYQNFFVEGKRVPDLESIILHEFGHMIGLNHSCENNPRNGVPNCNDTSISSDYLTASMFPAFSFDTTGLGEVRNTLNMNDQGRANCIYQSTLTSTPSSQ